MLRNLLLPLSLLYGLASWVNRISTRTVALNKPVISVGNLTWGGAGKTPATIKIVNTLAKRGLSPCVLTRGYKRKSSQPIIVSKLDKAQVYLTGDEPAVILESVENAVIGIGRDRVITAEAAGGRDFDYYLLDDGFQHWRIRRNYDIVLLDALNPFGNGHIIPAGILREPLNAIKRADLVIINRYNQVSELQINSLIRRIRKHFKGSILHSKAVIKRIVNFGTLKELPDSCRDLNVFCGLGNNANFELMLRQNGFKILSLKWFQDHYWYTVDDIKAMFEAAANEANFVTTLKDYVKIRPLLEKFSSKQIDRLFYVIMDLEFKEGESAWQEELTKALQFSSTETAPL